MNDSAQLFAHIALYVVNTKLGHNNGQTVNMLEVKAGPTWNESSGYEQLSRLACFNCAENGVPKENYQRSGVW